MECFSYKGRCGIHVLRHLKVELAWAIDKWLIWFIMLFTTILYTKELKNK